MNGTANDIYQKLLSQFISFKSISTDPTYAPELEKTAEWLDKLLAAAGFKTERITGYGNPIVLAHYTLNPQAKTMLIYGHYDVQPAALEEGWTSEPFSVGEKDGRYIARGAVDNKGQVLIHIATVLHLIQTKQLTFNVTFFIEGNEETGSPELEKCVRDYTEKLTSDYVMISDGEIVSEIPVIEVGFRGVMNAEIKLHVLKNDLHSGLYGGVAPSAAHEAAALIKTFHTEEGLVALEGFYDDVQEPTQEQLENNKRIPFSEEEYTKITGSNHILRESNYDIYTQIGLRPSLEVTGLHAGYTGVGYRNSIPAESVIKLNIRLVAGQSPETIAQLLQDHVLTSVPQYVQVDVEIGESAPSVIVETNDPIFSTVSTILTDIWGRKPVYKYVGGSIPIVQTFQELLGAPILLIPLGNEDCNMHGVDENFRKDFVEKGLQFSATLLSEGQVTF